jgi:hypothetical protein
MSFFSNVILPCRSSYYHTKSPCWV